MIIIGEKINGSIPGTKKAIEKMDADYIRKLAKIQTEAGATYIDVCASINEGELDMVKWLVDLVQEVSDLPICLDSPDPQVCIDAMAFCNKPGLVNSISLEGDKIKILPALQGTKWNVVALLCDDTGIPKDADTRIEIFKKIMTLCDEYDIGPERIFIDPLVEGLATTADSLLTFAETTRRIKELYPTVHVTSGLSNISYGLPGRKLLNMPFMTLAMNAGMDSAIVDPTDRDMMGAIYATEALLAEDFMCLDYIGAFRENKIGPLKK